MSDLHDILESDASAEHTALDIALIEASALVQKQAAAQGIDLSKLPEPVVAELLDLALHEKTSSLSEPTNGETPMSNQVQVTHAEVALELSKIAQSEKIDLSKVAKAELEEMYNTVAQAMAQPGYHEKKAALDAENERHVELGRMMAQGFHEELLKKAGEMPPQFAANKGKAEGEDGDDEEEKKKKGKEKEAADAAAKVAAAVGGKPAAAPAADPKLAFDTAVLNRARAILLESGINPDTGTKIASDEERIELGARELLAANGFLTQAQG